MNLYNANKLRDALIDFGYKHVSIKDNFNGTVAVVTDVADSDVAYICHECKVERPKNCADFGESEIIEYAYY